ncbi:hypothetical protein GCM10018781_60900 [Kitasatospora indigofera]|uniref:Uncharacterized protein n=1 Tax=Kitasatospora indigofera TaxID=67307 RepID=A0A919G9E1_9ACTN|nr:hypothetical protein [Kitasatospora indigofera]GHH80465.1 hypothetical protein GCM10018781_60900 [Kitasatospora indigofera]
MRKSNKLRALGAAAFVITGALALPSPAQARVAITWEEDFATSSAPVFCDVVSLSGYTDGGFSCFQKYGDVLQVRTGASDANGNIRRMSVQWKNELKDKNGNWNLYRYGECFNDLGTDLYGVCNKDFYEDSTTNKLGGKGSRLAIKHCIQGVCEPWSIWFRNDQ